jgi:NitT/TauT family transport system ATP-binding protein
VTGGASAIAIRSLSKVYGTADDGLIEALRDISFDVAAGEFVSVVGPSGCGKSTLLKIIAGILPPSGGEIALDGRAVSGPSTRIGVVFQAPVLLPWRTILDNVLLPIAVRRLPRREYVERAAGLLRLVGLEGFERRHPHELSGGMQQRAAICRALITDPALLAMDEPFGALDALTRESMNLELLRIWDASRKTVFFITHSIGEAVFLSDRVIVMTPRPGAVDEIIPIDLPRPRGLELMGTEPFAAYTDRVRRRLGSQGMVA